MTMIQQTLQFLPIIIALCGLFLTLYIFTKKKSKQILVCPLNSNCDAVVNSKYSKFLGVSLEVLGMGYFTFLFLFFLSVFFVPGLINYGYFVFIIPMVAFSAFLFSIYLVLIQLLLIKQWCVWCLVSAILCITEFALILKVSPLNVKGLLMTILNI